MDTALVVKALYNATTAGVLQEGLIVHSDRGNQYTSHEFRNKLKELGIRQSFSAKCCTYDNAPIESFHAILKKELVYRRIFKDFEQAQMELFKYIESHYNTTGVLYSTAIVITAETSIKVIACKSGLTDSDVISLTYKPFSVAGEWKKNFGGSSDDCFNSVVSTNDGFVGVGYSWNSSFSSGDFSGLIGKVGYDSIIVKYDINGTVEISQYVALPSANTNPNIEIKLMAFDSIDTSKPLAVPIVMGR